MSIIQKELKAQIKQKKKELSRLWEKVSDLLKTKEAQDLKEFIALMQNEPLLSEYISSDLAEAVGSTAKKLRKKAKIEFEAAHLLWENYHANGTLSNDSLAQAKAALDMAKDEISKRQAELKDAEMQLTAQAINQKLAQAYDYEQVVVPVIERLIPGMIVKYGRLAKAFNRSVELIEEGGPVAVIGKNEMESFLFDYESFNQDIIKLKVIIAQHQHGIYRELRSGKLKNLCNKFETLFANATKLLESLQDTAVDYSNVDFLISDLYGASCPSSIFNLLVDDGKVDLFIDGRFKQKDVIKQNILDRIKLCWKSGVDCFFGEGIIEGAKYDALLGVKTSALEGVDFAFDKNVYNALQEKVDEIDLSTSMEILEIASKARIAGNVYSPIPTLTFDENFSEPYVSSSYGVRSIVGKLAPNLLLKVDKVGDVPGMGWIGNTTAEYMNYALLMSAGGGRVYMNKAALIAFAAISNSVVDVKAYIASVAGSSCIEEKSVMSAIGTVIWVYVDKDGKPITRNGRIRGKKNSNEGSSWNLWGGNLSFQERTIAEAWCKYLEEINQTQAKFSLDFQKYINRLKTEILVSSFISATWNQPENGLKYKSGLDQVKGILFTEQDNALSLKKESRGYAPGNLTIYTGNTGVQYVRVPKIVNQEVTRLLVQRLPQFELKTETDSMLSVEISNAKWALDVWSGLRRLIQRVQNQGIEIDWADYFTNGSDPLVKDYLKAFDCSWDWTKAPRKQNVYNAFKAQVDGFSTFRTKAGKTIIDIRQEMEDSIEWPKFKGIETLWGFEPKLSSSVKEEIEFVLNSKKLSDEEWMQSKTELLEKFPALIAKRLEQAVELKGFDPEIWSNTLATGIIGKGKSLPINLHKLFVPWNNSISADNLRGEVSEAELAKWLLVSFVKNKDDGGCKSKDYKGFLKSIGEAEIESKFDLDDEKSADPGQAMVPVGYMFGEPMRVRVAIMRRMKLGKVGATFQATEKKPTELSTGWSLGRATEKSSTKFLEYWGIVPCGGKLSRTELPQIPAKLRESFLDSLEVDYEDVIARSNDLQPLQEFVSEANSKSTKPLLISLDGYIIDGHHRWYANRNSEFISCVIVHMKKDELLEKAKAFESSYFAKPTRFELALQFFNLMKKLKMQTKSGQTLTPWQFELNPYDPLLPGKIYSNMMEALCRIEVEDLFDSVEESIARSLDGELLKTLKAMNIGFNSSAKLGNKFVDSINAKLANFARGAVIKAVNIPVHVFDAIEQGTVILPPSMRVKTYDGKKLALAFRYPIASATSVGVVKVIFGDDALVKPLLEGYGIDFAAYPDVVFMSSGDKTNYQFDDDGDCFGILCEPKFIQADWDLCVARALNEFQGKYNKHAVQEDGTINKRKYSKSLWKTVKSWVAIAMNLLERRDYDSQNIEMSDVKTDNNKKSMEVIDLRGHCTVEFQKWSHRDGRGPVGLISDLFTVILASGSQGVEFTRLACIAGYILQHSIDSAKKEKLVIPPAVLLAYVVWETVNGKLELRSEVNDIVKDWNAAWEAMDATAILAIENKANNLYFEDAEGNFYNESEVTKEMNVTAVSWLPTMKTILANCKVDDQVLFYAPSTLLARMSNYAIKGSYGTFDFFGTKVPVHPKLVDAADPTRYISAHTLEIHQFTDEDGKIVPWKAFSAFRKINILDYLHFATRVEVKEKDGKKEYGSPKVSWSQRTDLENFPAYFKDTFEGNIWESYPNLIFKFTLRWAIELCFDGATNLKQFSKLWNEDNEIEAKSFVMPNFVWNIEQSPILRPTAEQSVMVGGKGGKVLFADKIGKSLRKELLAFFTANVMYYKSESKTKWSVDLWNLMLDWVEAPMTMASVVKDAKLDRNAFYLAYTKVMRQVGLYLLASDQYVLASEEHVSFVKSLGVNSSERKHLTRYMIGDNLYEYAPNPLTVRLANIINSRYVHAITKGGRNPENRWQPSFHNPTWNEKIVRNKYQIEPHWYVGSRNQWSNEMKANVTDLVVASLNRHIPVYACDITESLIEDLSQIEDVHKYIKGDDKGSNPFIGTLLQHNVKHFQLTGESISECQCCQTHIRKFVTKVAREDRFEAGSKEHFEYTARNANVAIAKELITAVKAQCEFLVNEALTTNNFDFTDNPFGLRGETINGYVEEFGSDLVKAKFGLPLQSDFETFADWNKLWGNLELANKSVFVVAITKESPDLWWNLPIGYLLHNLEAWMQAKKLIQVKENEEPKEWMTLSEWKSQQSDPTPPSGGGGGGANSNNKKNVKTKIMVTGHRPQKLGGFKVNPTQTFVKEQLERVIKKLDNGSVELVTGMALGVDQWFCEIGLGLGLKVHAYLPCKGQSKKWDKNAQEKHKELTLQCDWRLISKDTYQGPHQLLNRNTAMVSDSNIAIIVWDGKENGGTWDAVQKIRKASNIKLAIHINPSNRKVTVMFER